MVVASSKNLSVTTHFSQSQMIIGPLQVITAADEIFNHVDEGLSMWTGSGDRSVTVGIVFVRSFKERPEITVSITGMDCDHTTNQRYWLKATNIRTTGFTLEFSTWDTTRIARAGVSWQAIGKARVNPVAAKNAASK